LTHWFGFNLSTKTVIVVEHIPEEHRPIREALLRVRDRHLVVGKSHTALQYIWSVLGDLKSATGMDDVTLSKHMQKINTWLIVNKPLEYIYSVARAMASCSLPYTTELAHLNSRVLLGVWSLLHFLVVGLFWLQFLALAGTAVFRIPQYFSPDRGERPVAGLRITEFQTFSYVIAFAICLYTVIISCTVDVGDPRQRIPIDMLVVFLVFLGLHIWFGSVNRFASRV